MACSDFERLYEEHVWAVYGFVGYRVRSREEAEDLTQQTFERALKAYKRFDPERASEKTWLFTIARNLIIDAYRRSGGDEAELEAELEAGPPQLSTTEPEQAPGLGPDPELARALSRLSDRDREVIALRFGGDLKGTEIAELTGLSLANVQQILSRSLRRLRDELAAQSDTRSGSARA